MSDQTPEPVEDVGERLLLERQESNRIKKREANTRVVLLTIAFVAIVAGVLYPIWDDKSDSDRRRRDLDTLAQNSDAVAENVRVTQEIVSRMDEDDSPESQMILVNAVESLIEIVRCDNRANLDDLITELESRGLIKVSDSALSCPTEPSFEFPPSEPGE